MAVKPKIYSPVIAQLAVWKAAIQLMAEQQAPAVPDFLEPDWRIWQREHFPRQVSAPLAERHLNLGNWFEQLTPGIRPRPRIEPWPRGGGKSTSTELGVVRLAKKLTRRFVLYVCNRQDQADKHVQDIGLLIETLGLGRGVNLYGQATGWRRSELRTASGFNVMAYGLDTALRGIKIGEYRPDLIIFDDVDQQQESELVRNKKINTITKDILPAGSVDVAVLFIQNIIHEDSIANQILTGTADFLIDREVGTFEPAVRDLEYELQIDLDGKSHYVITKGEATWAGQSIAICEGQMTTWGALAFLQESQHRIDLRSGGLWSQTELNEHRVTKHPTLVRVAVSVDPNIKQGGDAAGIIVVGIDRNRHGYVLADLTTAGGPKVWSETAVAAYYSFHCTDFLAEDNQGGEMVQLAIDSVQAEDGEKIGPSVDLIHASDGKLPRALPVQKLYDDGRIHHVGYHNELEKELTTWQPGMPSPNRMDALVQGVTRLLLVRGKHEGWREYMQRERERMAEGVSI